MHLHYKGYINYNKASVILAKSETFDVKSIIYFSKIID